MSFAWWLSLGVGFLSLSQEILWVRLGAFSFSGVPQIFSFVLANYLIGIALGAQVGKWFCSRGSDLYFVGGATLLLAAVTDILTPTFAPWVLRSGAMLPLAALALIVTAAIKSVLFPIAHHLGSNQSGSRIGSSVSKVYFGNILGSTLGPIVTGFYLLDRFSTEACFIIVGLGSLVLGVLMLLKSEASLRRHATLALGLLALLACRPWSVPQAIALLADHKADNLPISHMVQNKHGILHTLKAKDDRDITIGGNVYDGVISTNMDLNLNHLERAYILAAAHPAPKRVLVVGLSTGAWARVVLGFPGVESMDIVEINPGYIELIRQYPEVSPVLSDQRVKIHIDDGRRWLKRHPAEQYDLIVQNTTFHWRSNITNLVSLEYFSELKSHLRPGGIAAINTTHSADVVATAVQAFGQVFKFSNFVYGSDRDIRFTPEIGLQRLGACRIGEHPAFLPRHFEPGGVAHVMAHQGFMPAAQFLAQPRPVPAEVITDQNMLTEFRHGKLVAPAPLRWMYPPNPRAH